MMGRLGGERCAGSDRSGCRETRACSVTVVSMERVGGGYCETPGSILDCGGAYLIPGLNPGDAAHPFASQHAEAELEHVMPVEQVLDVTRGCGVAVFCQEGFHQA